MSFFKCLGHIWLFLALFLTCQIKKEADLEMGFVDPPEYTKPWVYWYWIDENISKEGITKDLEAMRRVGIGQAMIGHVSPGNKRGNVRVLTDEWWEMVEYAVSEGQRIGVDIGFFNGPGWSQSGGPWIKPEEAMQYVDFNEILVNGPARIQEILPAPETYFLDISVLAFRRPSGENAHISNETADISSVPIQKEVNSLFDGNLRSQFLLPDICRSDTFTIDISSDELIKAQAITFHPTETPLSIKIEIQVEKEGLGFRTIRTVNMDRRKTDLNIGPMLYAPYSISIPLVKTKAFKLKFYELWGNHTSGFKEIELTNAARVEMVAEKQLGKMFPHPLPEWDAYLWSAQPEPLSSAFIIHPDSILNISEFMSPTGKLKWQVPAGEWVIQRIYSVPTGMKNAPMPREAAGLECDKLSESAVQTHFDSFIGKFLREVPPEQRKSLKRVVIDSYEVGPQNWTKGLQNIFRDRLGYDPIPWLPVLSGRIIGSADQSNRFLWDLRRLTADLIADHYMSGMRKNVNDHGLKLWVENYGHWGFPAEFLQYGGRADEVAGEFWFQNPYWDLGRLELRGASSATNTYGKSFTSAEAFTAGFNFRQDPGSMKSRGDWAYSHGINQFVLHLYIHQPWEDRKPGVNAWFGMSFQRHNTWFEQSREWVEYMRRCHFLLQKGKHVADVCYFIGEGAPKMTGVQNPTLPAGYDFDFINAEVIEQRLTVEDGWLKLPDGMRYRLMVLPPQETMRPELLRKLKELVSKGAAIYGPPPRHSPSLTNYPTCDREVLEMAMEIWGNCDGTKTKENTLGKGRVFYGDDLPAVLGLLNILPDVICEDTSIVWTHRRSDQTDIYFLSNQSGYQKRVPVSFRIRDKMPEIWYPDKSNIEKSAYFSQLGDHITIPLDFESSGSLFVIFKDGRIKVHVTQSRVESNEFDAQANASFQRFVYNSKEQLILKTPKSGIHSICLSNGNAMEVDAGKIPIPVLVKGPWELKFPEGRGLPREVILDSLCSYTEYPHEGIRHFSGTATYKKIIQMPSSWSKEEYSVLLNLGEVGMLAEVVLNGHPFEVLWKDPFEIDITDFVRAGDNLMEIKVTNVWWNRLIGDEKYPRGSPGYQGALSNDERTYVTVKAWTAEDELLPSGLMGPVTLSLEKKIPIKLE